MQTSIKVFLKKTEHYNLCEDCVYMEWNPCCPLTRPNCGAADRNGTELWKNHGISAPRPGGVFLWFSQHCQISELHKLFHPLQRNTCLLWVDVLHMRNSDYFGWLCCQRSEIICHLAELLTERKEEILAANKADMDLAVNAGNFPQGD